LTPDTLEGGCFCGAVRYRVTGDPKWSAHCHCESCRRAAGGPVVTYAGYETGRFAFTAGEPKVYAKVPGTERHFCGTCGSTLTFRSGRWPGEIHILLATLDDPEAVTPECHVHVDEQLGWIHMDDGLPTYTTVGSDSE